MLAAGVVAKGRDAAHGIGGGGDAALRVVRESLHVAREIIRQAEKMATRDPCGGAAVAVTVFDVVNQPVAGAKNGLLSARVLERENAAAAARERARIVA